MTITRFDITNPHYKECLIKTGSGSCVVKIVVDPYCRILYSTKGSEIAQVQELMEQGLNQNDAVEQIATKLFKQYEGQ